MKALVTGGAGALGSSLVKILLKKGYEVYVMETLQVDGARKLREVRDKIKYHWKSIHDITPKDLDGIDLVVHCAAQPDRPFGISSPIYTMDTNVMGLTRVLEACKESGIEKFLLPGSGTIFTGVPHLQLPVTEDTTPAPTNPYSASKYMAEILCDTYRRCYGLPTVILRSGLVYGRGMRLDISIAQFIIHSLKGEEYFVRSSGATRTPTHIDDVLLWWEAVIDADPSKVIGQVFHSVYGKEYSIIQIAETVSKVVGKGSPQPTSYYEEGEIVRGRSLILTDGVAREWTTTKKADQLDIKMTVDLEEGVKRTVPYIEEMMK